MLPVIRKAIAADVAMLTPLFDAYRVFYGQPTDETAAAEFLMERFNKRESTIFVALMDEVAVGFMQLYPIFSSVSLRRTWLLNDLYVAQNARQQGIASALLHQAKLFGLEQKAKWLLLETGADNVTAQSLYEKNGWIKQTDLFYQLPLTT